MSEKWKDGDVLINRTDKAFSVYRKEKDNKSFINHIYISYDDYLFVNGWCWNKNYSLATFEEIEQFHKLLHKHRIDWDAEKKQIVNFKWKPKFNEKYWLVTTTLDVNFYTWKESPTDIQMLDCGNCFKTKEEAYVAAKKIRDLLKKE